MEMESKLPTKSAMMEIFQTTIAVHLLADSNLVATSVEPLQYVFCPIILFHLNILSSFIHSFPSSFFAYKIILSTSREYAILPNFVPEAVVHVQRIANNPTHLNVDPNNVNVILQRSAMGLTTAQLIFTKITNQPVMMGIPVLHLQSAQMANVWVRILIYLVIYLSFYLSLNLSGLSIHYNY